MLKELSTQLQSRTRALEILLVRVGVKNCARIAFADSTINHLGNLFSRLGLNYAVSDFKVNMEFRGMYSTKGEIIQDPSQPGHHFVYISRGQEACDAAKAAEERQDIAMLGKILGYPDCCIDFFLENRKSEIENDNDYILPAIKKSGKNNSFMMNLFARYFDFALISHAPHSLDCKPSLEYAEKAMQFLEQEDGDLAITYKLFMSGIGVYLNDGVLWLPLANLAENGSVDYDKVLSAPAGHPAALLLQETNICQLDEKNLKIGEHNISIQDWCRFV